MLFVIWNAFTKYRYMIQFQTDSFNDCISVNKNRGATNRLNEGMYLK